jgi:hypothetical protein
MAIAGLIPTVVLADFPAGQWTMSYYSEAGYGTGTQGICIQDGGTWSSDTMTAWSGKWHRRANNIYLQGNYAGGKGNTAFALTFIDSRLLTGYWLDWTDDNLINNYSRVKFVFKKELCNPSQ